jgi:hypothetical protein
MIERSILKPAIEDSMYVNSITHRNELFDLATRWWADQPKAGDGLFLTRMLAYENLVTGRGVLGLINQIKNSVHPGPVRMVRLRSKDDLRELIAQACRNPTPREAELFAAYRDCPEEFFPGTPSDATVGFREDGEILGMMRFKRIRRVADKTSRRIADALAGVITDTARQLARDRAVQLDTTLEVLLSSQAEMDQDFHQAEGIVARSFKDGLLTFKPEDLQIDDGIGLKFVGTAEEIRRMEAAIASHGPVVAIHREEHRGVYNDTNILVDLRLPPAEELLSLAAAWDWSRQTGFGLTAEELAAGFPAWIEGGERTFRVEVILTTREDYVESEYGISIHEARILEQRAKSAYSGRIANNAAFITRYMAMVALSPTVEVASIPVKMWGRYLPDAYAAAMWKLFGITQDRRQINPVIPWNGTDAELLHPHLMEELEAEQWRDRQNLHLMDLV